ncbi:MAG: ABC transporter substrate-binding protein [Arenicellales bacterium]
MSRVETILKTMLIGLAAMAAFVALAARADEAPFKHMLPKDIQSKGYLSVASEIQYPPFETFAADNKTVVGIDADIAAALGKELGVELRFVSTSFDAIIPGLVAKRYDMAMSAMTDNRKREKQVDFVDYFGSGGGILARTADKDKYKTLDSLCGVTVGIAKGTTEVADAEKQSAKCKAEGKPAINSQIFARQNDMVLALQSGRVDAAMADAPNSAATAQESKGQLVLTGPAYDKSVFGIVFPKGSDQLMKAVQAATQKIMDDGTYLAILKKYGQQDNAITKATINGALTD